MTRICYRGIHLLRPDIDLKAKHKHIPKFLSLFFNYYLFTFLFQKFLSHKLNQEQTNREPSTLDWLNP